MNRTADPLASRAALKALSQEARVDSFSGTTWLSGYGPSVLTYDDQGFPSTAELSPKYTVLFQERGGSRVLGYEVTVRYRGPRSAEVAQVEKLPL